MGLHNRFLNDEMYAFWLCHHVRPSVSLKKLAQVVVEHPLGFMQTPPEQMQFLAWLAGVLGVRRYLELGVFMGYSTLAMAEVLPDDAYILACDANPDFVAIARTHWTHAGVDHKIDLRQMLVAELFATFEHEPPDSLFDMAYIDADKPGTPGYFDQCCRWVRPGGVVVVDNLWYGGKVFADDEVRVPHGARVMRAFNRQVMDRPNVRFTSLPVGDGLGLAWVLPY